MKHFKTAALALQFVGREKNRFDVDSKPYLTTPVLQ